MGQPRPFAHHSLLDRYRVLLADLFKVDLAAVGKDENIPEAVERTIEALLSDYRSGWVRTQRALQRGMHVLRLRYGLLQGKNPMTYAELATEFGVSSTRIYDLLGHALRRMRHPKYLGALGRFVAPEARLSPG